MQRTVKTPKEKLVFILLPSVIIASIALITELCASKKILVNIIPLVLTFGIYIVYYCFKNGTFETIKHQFKHGYNKRWDYQFHNEIEIQECQTKLTTTVFGLFLFRDSTLILMSPLNSYGIYGWVASLLLIITVTCILFRALKRNAREQKRSLAKAIILHKNATEPTLLLNEFFYYTIIVIAIVANASQLYISFNTPLLWIWAVNVICFMLVHLTLPPHPIVKEKEIPKMVFVVMTILLLAACNHIYISLELPIWQKLLIVLLFFFGITGFALVTKEIHRWAQRKGLYQIKGFDLIE